MKSFTDIEQSKKLAEILPIESADMWYAEIYEGKTDGWNFIVSDTPYYSLSFTKPSENNYSKNTVKDIPCWSLAALLNYLKPNVTLEHTEGEGWKVESLYVIDNQNSILQGIKSISGFSEDDPIDACYEMILKLHEENLI